MKHLNVELLVMSMENDIAWNRTKDIRQSTQLSASSTKFICLNLDREGRLRQGLVLREVGGKG